MTKKRDRRRELLGHELKAGEDLVTRNVNRALKCARCGGPLQLNTVPMTGQTVEVCGDCGTSKPVHRFRPVGEGEPPGVSAS